MPSLETLSFAPGLRHCIHVPTTSRIEILLPVIAELSGVNPSFIHIASLPRRDYLFSTKPRPTLPVEWLAAVTHRTVAEAARVVSSLPVFMPRHFADMSLTPLRFLAFVAALYGDPAIVIYESRGMESRERYLLHRYAGENFISGALVHCNFGESLKCGLLPGCSQYSQPGG